MYEVRKLKYTPPAVELIYSPVGGYLTRYTSVYIASIFSAGDPEVAFMEDTESIIGYFDGWEDGFYN